MSTPDLPKTMRAILLDTPGPSTNLIPTPTHPLPPLKPGHILIRNAYAGINYIDTYFRSGLYPSATGYPLILGQEGAGVVADANTSDSAVAALGLNFKEGDRVVWIKQGGYAEYTSVPADRVVRIPSGLSEDLAVGGFLMGMTALSLVREAYAVHKGEKVLVHAAAGGVGLLLCQLLREVGAFVIGTAGGEAKGRLAKEHGADVVVDYSKEKWVERVMEITEGKGVDVVYDGVGESTWEGSLAVTRRKGKVVYFGNASGPVPPFQINRLNPSNISVMRASVMGYIVTREELEYYAKETLDRINDGRLKINVHKAYELEDVKIAHDDLEGRKTTGKLLLKLQGLGRQYGAGDVDMGCIDLP